MVFVIFRLYINSRHSAGGESRKQRLIFGRYIMRIDSGLFQHPSDKAALSALQAIPAFSQVMKAFMSFWSEKQFKLINTSTNLRLGADQMPKYYNMLPPICEKLGIDVPELYVKLDVTPNAYTYGDTNPFIVITSGMFETLPDELIPTVLAHECGHIACHHTLYTTMGRILLNTASSIIPVFSGFGDLILMPVKLAFVHWMRCSEFSADRAAAIYDNSPDKMVQACIYFAGYNKNINDNFNVEAFLRQAEEYRALAKDNALNSAMDTLLFMERSHPLNAVRALEVREWAATERFADIQRVIAAHPNDPNAERLIELTPSKYIGRNVNELQTELINKGFTDIKTTRITTGGKKDGAVTGFTVNGVKNGADNYYKPSAAINIEYFKAKTAEELAVEHPNEIQMPESSRFYVGKNFEDVRSRLEVLGFTNIKVKETAMPRFGIGVKKYNVEKILIKGQLSFEKGAWFAPNTEIILFYYMSY